MGAARAQEEGGPFGHVGWVGRCVIPGAGAHLVLGHL